MLTLAEQLLVCGGDERLALAPGSARNPYGCSIQPEPALAAFGSCTASSISARALLASEHLLHGIASRLNRATAATVYRQELERIRVEFHALCELTERDAVSTVFAASGTDLHLIASQLTAGRDAPPLHVIMMAASETGSGVPSALDGRHFSQQSALGGRVRAHEALPGAHAVAVSQIALRRDDGRKRALAEIDAQIEDLLQQSTRQGRRVLLVAIDVSKTGLIAPSPAYLGSVRQRYGDQVDVLVDACQFRLGNGSLKAYLELGCMVGLTGSKFLSGPVFSAALLIPRALVPRLSKQQLPAAMAAYSAKAEWPGGWRASEGLGDQANFGLLLRWQAALAELRAFRAIPAWRVRRFMQQFAVHMHEVLLGSPCFASLAEVRLERASLCREPDWDQIPSIFPFVLYDPQALHGGRQALTREQTLRIYRRLQGSGQAGDDAATERDQASPRYQFGQPVACGSRDGIPVSALRQSLSSRLIVQACEGEADAANRIMQRAEQAMAAVADQIVPRPHAGRHANYLRVQPSSFSHGFR